MGDKRLFSAIDLIYGKKQPIHSNQSVFRIKLTDPLRKTRDLSIQNDYDYLILESRFLIFDF
jgi:hypothetical protein